LWGCAPHPLLTGLSPSPPTQLGAKYLAAVVLDNQDRALRPKPKLEGFFSLELGKRDLISVVSSFGKNF